MSASTPVLTVGDLGEHAVIARILPTLPTAPWVAAGAGDDAAVVAPLRGTFDVLTTDALVDGIHFDTAFVPPRAIGHRALAVNLSDLAAMGAQPRTALLSLALPPQLPVATLDGFIAGFVALAAAEGVAVVGGNVTRTDGPWVVNVTATGAVHPRKFLRRSGARPGDTVYVTGALGAAAIGLRLARAQNTATSPCVERYLFPVARIRAGRQLSHRGAASSCMDLSDGLADGVRQLAAASGVGITIDANALPIPAEVREWHAAHGGDPIATALSGGDDYELLFTVRRTHGGRLRAVATRCPDLPITRIGAVTRDVRLLLSNGATQSALAEGYEHFR